MPQTKTIVYAHAASQVRQISLAKAVVCVQNLLAKTTNETGSIMVQT